MIFKKLHLLPLLLFILVVGFLARGLFLNPQDIPSAKINQTVPSFHITELMTGTQVDQSIFQGKWTLMSVWASWCEACHMEHAFILSLKNEPVELIGLNYKDAPKTAMRWIKHHDNPYKAILSDEAGRLAIEFGVYGTPETFLIDPSGIIRQRHTGILTKQSWNQSFKPILDKRVT